MKVCVLTHTFPRNSKDVPAAFMKAFCKGLVRTGNKVVVVTPYDKRFKASKNQDFKVVTYKYIFPDKFSLLGYSRTMSADINLKPFAYLLLPFMLFFGTIKLYKIVKKEKVDIISVHWILPNGLIALIVSKLTRIPYAVTLPGTDAYLASKKKLFGFFAKIAANNASAIFSNSRWHMERILNLGVNSKIKEVITYPVDISEFRPNNKDRNLLLKKLNLKDDSLIVLAVGRLVFKKGFKFLIESFPDVVKKFPKARLIIGGEGDLMGHLTKQAQKLHIADKIIFTGTLPRDKIVDFYNLADVMVSPSIVDEKGNVDGRPLVILESMACGKPQVVTNLPGISDELVNNKNAILIPQRNSKAISKAIIKLLSDKNLRRKMGKNNRELARKSFGIDQVGKKYNKFFSEILNR